MHSLFVESAPSRTLYDSLFGPTISPISITLRQNNGGSLLGQHSGYVGSSSRRTLSSGSLTESNQRGKKEKASMVRYQARPDRVIPNLLRPALRGSYPLCPRVQLSGTAKKEIRERLQSSLLRQ